MIKAILINKIAGPLIRHGATVLGGYLIAEGIADEAAVSAITGGIVAAGGVAVSFAEKYLRR